MDTVIVTEKIEKTQEYSIPVIKHDTKRYKDVCDILYEQSTICISCIGIKCDNCLLGMIKVNK